MDLAKFLVSSTSGSSSSSSQGSNSSGENKRLAMYKTGGSTLGQRNKNARQDQRRNKRKESRNVQLESRRGGFEEGAVVDEEDEVEAEENVPPPEQNSMRPKQAAASAKTAPTQNPKINQRQIERLQKLEEYKKKKAAEKEAAEKNKKKPFVVGKVHHHPGGNDLKEVSTIKFDFVGKTPGKQGMTPSGKVFRFTGNKVTTVMKSTVRTGGQSSVTVPRTGGYGTGVRITRSKAARIAESQSAASPCLPTKAGKVTKAKPPGTLASAAKPSTVSRSVNKTSATTSTLQSKSMKTVVNATKAVSRMKATAKPAKLPQNVTQADTATTKTPAPAKEAPSGFAALRQAMAQKASVTPTPMKNPSSKLPTNTLPTLTPREEGWGKTPSPDSKKEKGTNETGKTPREEGWGKTPSPVAAASSQARPKAIVGFVTPGPSDKHEPPMGSDKEGGEMETNSDETNFATPGPRTVRSIGNNKGTPFPTKINAEEKSEDDEAEEEERRDQLMPMTPITASQSKIRSARRTPRLGEVAELCDPFRPEVCFERGSFSERRKSSRRSGGGGRRTTMSPKSGDSSASDGILGGDEVVKSLDEEIGALVEDIDDNSMDVSLIARSGVKIASTSTDLGQSVDSSGVAADEPATLAPKRLDDELEEAQTEVEKEDGEENKVSEREKAVAHYRQQLATVKNKLNGLSQEWKLKEEGLAVDPNSEGARGQIRTAVGKTTIFMNAKGRLTQFETLVDACHNGGGEKETKPTDLEGFWDGIIVAQVEDIERDFQTLKAMESRGWNEAEPEAVPNNKVKKNTKKPGKKVAASKRPAAASSGLRAMIAAKRKQQAGGAGEEEKPTSEASLVPQQASPPKPGTPSTLSGTPSRISGTPSRLSGRLSSTPSRTPGRRSGTPTTPLLVLSVNRAARRSLATAAAASQHQTPQHETTESSEAASQLLKMTLTCPTEEKNQVVTLEAPGTPLDAPVFSSVASASGLGTNWTALSPFEKKKKTPRKSRRSTARQSTNLMEFNTPPPSESVNPNEETPKVRRSSRRSGVAPGAYKC